MSNVISLLFRCSCWVHVPKCSKSCKKRLKSALSERAYDQWL